MRFIWAIVSERRILVSIFSVTCNSFREFSHVGLVSACLSSSVRLAFGGSMSWKTQPKCRALDDRRPVAPGFNSWQVSRFISGRPDLSWFLSRLTTGCRTFSCQSFFFNMATALLSFFFLDLLLGCSSTWRCAYEHFSPNLQPLFVLKNMHSGGCHFSQNELVQVPLR